MREVNYCVFVLQIIESCSGCDKSHRYTAVPTNTNTSCQTCQQTARTGNERSSPFQWCCSRWLLYSLWRMYMGWFFSFGTNASVLSCKNVGRCHSYRRLLTCIPSFRAHDLARPHHRSCAVAPVRWVVGNQRSRKTVAVFSKQEQGTWIKFSLLGVARLPPRIAGGLRWKCTAGVRVSRGG